MVLEWMGLCGSSYLRSDVENWVIKYLTDRITPIKFRIRFVNLENRM